MLLKECMEFVFEVIKEVICLVLFGVFIIIVVYLFIFVFEGVEGKMFYLMVIIVVIVLFSVMVLLVIFVFVMVVLLFKKFVKEKYSLIICGVVVFYKFVLNWVLKVCWFVVIVVIVLVGFLGY